MEQPAGLRDAPLPCRDPEIEEVVVVEPVHADSRDEGQDISIFSMFLCDSF
jgi:hypothetical protein